jgi:hypothetical protein
LLEDDKLIYDFRVTTDALLTATQGDEAERDVLAIIKVKTKAISGGRFPN